MPKLEQFLPTIAVPPTLCGAVLSRIRHAEIRGLYWRISFSFIGLIASIGMIALSWSALWSELVGSSFIDLLRLAFSDSDIVFANLGSSINGLLESFPVLPVLLSLILLFCLLASVAFLLTLLKVRRVPSPHFA